MPLGFFLGGPAYLRVCFKMPKGEEADEEALSMTLALTAQSGKILNLEAKFMVKEHESRASVNKDHPPSPTLYLMSSAGSKFNNLVRRSKGTKEMSAGFICVRPDQGVKSLLEPYSQISPLKSASELIQQSVYTISKLSWTAVITVGIHTRVLREKGTAKASEPRKIPNLATMLLSDDRQEKSTQVSFGQRGEIMLCHEANSLKLSYRDLSLGKKNI